MLKTTTRNKLALALAGIALCVLAACGEPTPNINIGKTAQSQTKTSPIASPRGSDFITGYSRPSWGAGQFGSTEEQKTFSNMLATINPSCVGVVVTQYLTQAGATQITPTNYTVTDSDLVAEFRQIHKAGKCVFFSPHVDYYNSTTL